MPRRAPAKDLPGEKIRHVREALHLTQEQLAAEFGYSLRHMLLMEQTSARPIFRYALIGLLATRGKPFGMLWPE